MTDPHAPSNDRPLRPCPLEHEDNWRQTAYCSARVAVNLLIYHAWKSGQTDWTLSPAGADLDFARLREDPPCQACDTVAALAKRLPALWPDIQLRFRQILAGGPNRLLPADASCQGRLQLLLDGKRVDVEVDHTPDLIRLRLHAVEPEPASA